MKAYLKNYRQSPRKVRLVANLIKGKKVDQALIELDFLVKRASFPLKKLLLSAVANAKASGFEKENLIVKDVRVDKGIVMKRIMPAAMGSAHRINKRTSHVVLVLAEKDSDSKEKKTKKVKSDKARTPDVSKETPKEERKEKKAIKKTPALPKARKINI